MLAWFNAWLTTPGVGWEGEERTDYNGMNAAIYVKFIVSRRRNGRFDALNVPQAPRNRTINNAATYLMLISYDRLPICDDEENKCSDSASRPSEKDARKRSVLSVA